MKILAFLLWTYVYYFMMAGFIWLIAPYFEFSEITSYPPLVFAGGILSLLFAGYTVLDSE